MSLFRVYLDGIGVLKHFLFLSILLCSGFVPIWQKRRVDNRNRVKVPREILKVLDVGNGHGYILFEWVEQVDNRSNEFNIRIGVKREVEKK